MDDLALALIACASCLVVISWLSYSWNNLAIPTVGYNGVLMSYWSAFRFVKEGNAVLQEGYAKYKNKAFKVPLMDRWLVVVTGDQLYETLRSAPDNVLSAWEAMKELLQIEHTLGLQIIDPSHIDVIRTTLNKNLGSLLPRMNDEARCAFESEIGSKLCGQEWTPIAAAETFQRMMCQVSSRAFVGLPLCRNKNYCQLSIQFTTNVMTGAAVINLFPRVLKPLVGALFNKLSRHQAKMLRFLGPEIEARRRKYNEFGMDYEDKPNDMLTWVMESAAPGSSTSLLALRMLNVNFMAIHSTSVSFTHAVYNLAAHPQYLDVLREEIHMYLDVSGRSEHWTLADLEHCIKLDSFLKESLRLNGLGAISLPRKAMIQCQLPDGTIIPPGTIVTAASTAAHLDSARYQNAEKFDGLRFARMRKTGSDISGEDAKHRLTSAGSSFLTFGGGKHICPGRFFGSMELKCMLIDLLLNFDVKAEEDGARPPDEWMGPTSMPSRSAKVLFRRRKHVHGE